MKQKNCLANKYKIMKNNKQYIIGIDIGGSKIIVAVVENRKVYYKIKSATPKNRKEFLNKLELMIKNIFEKAGGRKNILGIGCGFAGALDLQKGTILDAPNVEILEDFNIKSWLQHKFNCDVKIDNDARCFLRSEYIFGAGQRYKNVVGITFGTGIGGGIIINSKMVYGANGSAGETGHMVINLKTQNSKLKTYDWEQSTVKQMRKNKFSEEATREFEKNLGIGFANIINFLDPDAIIIGGGVAESIRTILPKAKATMNKFVISPKSRRNIRIIIGKLGEDAGAIGAAALFYE